MQEVAVIAYPYALFHATDYYPDMPTAIQRGMMVASEMSVKPVVTFSEDQEGADIVVIGQRLKGEVVTFAVAASMVGSIPTGCAGSVSGNEVAAIARHMRFHISNRNFGSGRAGENRAAEGNDVPIEVNADALRDMIV